MTIRQISLRKTIVALFVGLIVGFMSCFTIILKTNVRELSDFDTRIDAAALAEQIRVGCWVMTMPKHHQERDIHIKATWGRRCNVLIFMSSEEDPYLPAVKLNVTESYGDLWGKTKKGFAHMYDQYKDDVDWFLKADDDTYVIMENLRFMLRDYNASDPLFFGSKYKAIVETGYMSGGAGYVLSKEAVRRFVTQGIEKEICRIGDKGAEDVELGRCMAKLNVTAGDSRDVLGRGRFFPFDPEGHIIPEKNTHNWWYWQHIYYPIEEGMGCCSDFPITFHYIKPNKMYVMEYMIYHLKTFGVQFPHDTIPMKDLFPPPLSDLKKNETNTTQKPKSKLLLITRTINMTESKTNQTKIEKTETGIEKKP